MAAAMAAAIAGCAQQTAPARTLARQDDAGLVSGPGAAPWSFRAPAAIAAAGNRVWVADQGASAVYELSATTGALIRIISGRRYGVWVPGGGASVTEISATTGGLIRSLRGPRYQFGTTDPVAVGGGRVWVGSSAGGSTGNSGGRGGNSVTEISATTGALRHVTRSLPSLPMAIAAAGGTAWVAMNAGAKGTDGGGPHGAVAEISARTGALIRVISSPRYRVGDPQSVTVDGGHVWVATADYPGPGGSVTEISAATGGLIRVVSGGRAQPARR